MIAEIVRRAAKDAGLQTHAIPTGMRLRKTGIYSFVFNYSAETQHLPDSLGGEFVIGGRELGPAGVVILRNP